MKTLALTLSLFLPLIEPAASSEVSSRMAVEGAPNQEYFLIDHSAGEEPRDGYKLLLVLPGGDGSADFNPFVTNIGKNAAGPEWLVAQLVAVKWAPDQEIVWPTRESKVKQAEFTTEEFLGAVIADIRRTRKLNPDHVYTLSWSSGGPAAYAASLEVDAIKGSFVAMSVFKPEQLPPLANARDHRYYILHSPDDKVCPFRMAVDAKERLSDHGAHVELASYDGGHGWHGNVFQTLRTGIAWLEKR